MGSVSWQSHSAPTLFGLISKMSKKPGGESTNAPLTNCGFHSVTSCCETTLYFEHQAPRNSQFYEEDPPHFNQGPSWVDRASRKEVPNKMYASHCKVIKHEAQTSENREIFCSLWTLSKVTQGLEKLLENGSQSCLIHYMCFWLVEYFSCIDGFNICFSFRLKTLL